MSIITFHIYAYAISNTNTHLMQYSYFYLFNGFSYSFPFPNIYIYIHAIKFHIPFSLSLACTNSLTTHFTWSCSLYTPIYVPMHFTHTISRTHAHYLFTITFKCPFFPITYMHIHAKSVYITNNHIFRKQTSILPFYVIMRKTSEIQLDFGLNTNLLTTLSPITS